MKNMYETRVDMTFLTPTCKEKKVSAGTLVATSEFDGRHAKMVKVSTIDGKASIEIAKNRANVDLKPCSLTMRDGEILVGEFRSENHLYHAFGYNVGDIVNKIVAMYNGYAFDKWTARQLALDEEGCYSLDIYKVAIDGLAIDEEYNCLCEKHEAAFVGDYFSKYRTPRIVYGNKKDYFAK